MTQSSIYELTQQSLDAARSSALKATKIQKQQPGLVQHRWMPSLWSLLIVVGVVSVVTIVAVITKHNDTSYAAASQASSIRSQLSNPEAKNSHRESDQPNGGQAADSGSSVGGANTHKRTSSGAQATVSAESKPIVIHIIGEVKKPGLYSLPAQARINDAVNAAGGLSQDAEPAGVNLARFVTDGEQIRVPKKGEQIAPDQSLSLTSTADIRININTADTLELTNLHGIGPALAERIIEYRSRHGKFKDIEELQNVPGIGPSIMERLKDKVAV